ncbi:helix-turn-helix transcriptional regulator [Paenibacillus cymbidii]|uniref:helix-turn-helix transcriptional regulator n=1 Tax=Paenibacillus cymbidii TaxID=1639034 RepID=UPI0014367B35|nr:AraC family transcriptional regulator [Paenibacillus cymbidii]
MLDLPHETRAMWLHRPTPLEKLWGIWPLSMGLTITKPTYRMASPAVSGYGLVYIDGGVAHFTDSKGRERLLGKNTLFCLIPGVMHQYSHAEAEQPLRMYWIAFNGKQSLQMLHRIGFSEDNPFIAGWDESRLLPIWQSMEQVFASEETTDRLSFVLLLIRWFDELLEQARQRGYEQLPSTDLLLGSIEFMNHHFASGIRIQDVAKHAGMTRSHYTKVFTERMGCSPKAYLQRLRMEKAMQYLKETRFSLAEIALAISYPDAYAFSRAFSQYYGYPPSRIRSTD